MKWRQGRRSGNIDDRRGRPAFGAAGLLRMLPMLLSAGRRGGIGGIVVILVVLWIMGGGLPDFFSGGAAGDVEVVDGVEAEESAEFVAAILASTEDAWSGVFAERGLSYRAPELVLFEGQVSSGCGFQSSATGPFYCPLDQKVYLDLGFFRQLAAMGGSGDFAAAYVIGHEVGHHVQNLLGTSERVRNAQRTSTSADANALSVALELQADCYAGVWGNRTERAGDVRLSPGDVEEGLEAARAIGDDRIAGRRGGIADPESFTHGSSEQRAQWLRLGLSSGDFTACDPFGG